MKWGKYNKKWSKNNKKWGEDDMNWINDDANWIKKYIRFLLAIIFMINVILIIWGSLTHQPCSGGCIVDPGEIVFPFFMMLNIILALIYMTMFAINNSQRYKLADRIFFWSIGIAFLYIILWQIGLV